MVLVDVPTELSIIGEVSDDCATSSCSLVVLSPRVGLIELSPVCSSLESVASLVGSDVTEEGYG